MNTNKEQDERAAFEAWYAKRHPEPVDKNPTWAHAKKIDDWEVWQAALDCMALRQPAAPAPTIDYTPGKWFDARTIDEMQAFYMARLPAIREAAKEHGYAIGLHGSTRRDFDLMAMQWRDGASDKDSLARAIADAACGIRREGAYDWEKKPNGRAATSIPICWTFHENPDFGNMISAGCIDLSIIDTAPVSQPAAQEQQPALTVWCGSMPESNGKSNFTAMLVRKDAQGLDKFDGFTIARSEYPDRVRYDADCVRHLIGELKESPDILDYDADKHSGYTAPQPAAPAGNEQSTAAWESLRADVLHGVDGLDNDQVNIVLGMIDYYMPEHSTPQPAAPALATLSAETIYALADEHGNGRNASGNYVFRPVALTKFAEALAAAGSATPVTLSNEAIRKLMHNYSRMLQPGHYSDTEFDCLQDVIGFVRACMAAAGNSQGQDAKDAARWRAFEKADSTITLRLHYTRPDHRAATIDAAMAAALSAPKGGT